jgi:hypothetical protein
MFRCCFFYLFSRLSLDLQGRPEYFQCLQDEFSAVITKALMTLVHGVETKFDAEMVAMTRVPWSTLESVGDQSE